MCAFPAKHGPDGSAHYLFMYTFFGTRRRMDGGHSYIVPGLHCDSTFLQKQSSLYLRGALWEPELEASGGIGRVRCPRHVNGGRVG